MELRIFVAKAGSQTKMEPLPTRKPAYFRVPARRLACNQRPRHSLHPRLPLRIIREFLSPNLCLVDPALLTGEETAWLDAYHARVRDTLAPLVDAQTRAWLSGACAPLKS